MIENTWKKLLVPVVITALLAGCAAPPQNDAAPASATATTTDPCSVGTTAVAGAAVGALIGALAGGTKGALIGAAAGGVLGGAGCYAVNVRSRQVRTAAQVDRDYIAKRGALPPQPQLIAYKVEASNQAIRGKPFTVNTEVELVNGRYQQIHDVKEQIVLLDPKGQPFKNGTKPLESRSASGGRFENSFELTLPQGVSQGVYAMKTNLYVNGQLVASRDLSTQLVIDHGEATVVAAM
ncbi:hypothetical protein [Paraburkholderia graminis]|uniref:hypothetical protein n=1 Tax=Paraburkholderia graminis TaxID=60548 RepID=UPI00278E8D57|nr:hypothetical protein [Paraburkholderia graminis]MDQ0627101.1 putative lipoprotein YmbA [Paraburkholderia graminis]